MQTRTHSNPAAFSQRASARRRVRRASASRLFCSTNGCATLMQPENDGRLAVCPICGARRLLH
jgi:membrane protease subunit (stomatin/prohibitin family)